MILRLSQFAHLLPVADGRVLVIHAITHSLVADAQLAEMIEYFREPRRAFARRTYAGFTALIERGILTDKTLDEELAEQPRVRYFSMAGDPPRRWQFRSHAPRRKGSRPTGRPARRSRRAT